MICIIIGEPVEALLWYELLVARQGPPGRLTGARVPPQETEDGIGGCLSVNIDSAVVC